MELIQKKFHNSVEYNLIFRLNLKIVLIILSVFFMGELQTVFAQNEKKEIFAKKIESEIYLDGSDNDKEWASIPGDSSFLQIDPDPGSPPAFKTVVKVAYTETDVYFLFICYDPEPNKLVTRELKYDGFTSGDDNVKLIIDTFGDERNGYWFATNPLSVKNDALVSGRSYNSFNEDWDAIWEVKSAIHPDRWCAEFRIPLSSLKFPGTSIQKWGVNFQRGIRRLSQDVIWSGAVRNGFLLDLTRAGNLKGIENIQRGNPIYLLPYVNVGYEEIKSSTNSTFKAGLDLKYGLSDAFTLDLTLNTDFAQVEADIAEINLSRFPLFIPEKREFFLEGNKLFSFDLASNNMAFYSRTIGISRGEGIPIIGGLKLTGTSGNLEAGFLSVQTEGTSSKKTTNYIVSRAKYSFFDNSHAGLIFSNTQTFEKYNRLAGVDLSFNFNNFLGDQNLIVTTKLAGTFDGKITQNNLAGILEVEYPNDLINIYSSYGFTQENFNPETGFIFNKGINEFQFSAGYAPRFNDGLLRRLRFVPVNVEFDHDPQGKITSFEYNIVPLSVTFESNDRIDFEFSREYDRPERDFTIFNNTVIKQGEYYGNVYGIEAISNPARALYGSIGIESGDFYGGTRYTYGVEATAALSSKFGFSLGYRVNDIKFPGDELQTNEIFTRFKYTLNVNMASFLLLQWNNEINEINLNYKLNIKPSLGSDIYLVINKILSTQDGLVSKDFVVILKVSWMFII